MTNINVELEIRMRRWWPVWVDFSVWVAKVLRRDANFAAAICRPLLRFAIVVRKRRA